MDVTTRSPAPASRWGLPLASTRLQPIARDVARGAQTAPALRRRRRGIVTALAAAIAAAVVLAAPAQAGRVADAVRYLESRQQAGGGFAEPGRAPEPGLTAWAVLGLTAAGRPPQDAARYLSGQPYPTATDLELRILALAALGRDVGALAAQLEGLRRGSGAIGSTVNSTIWGVIALRAAGRPVGSTTVRYLLRQQRRNGGYSWHARGRPDSNDTAAAVQALRAAGVPARSRPIRRAISFIRRHQNPDGGFELTRGRGSDAPSTAWAIQALLAAGRKPGPAAFAYLGRLHRPDGSYRYSARFVSNPVWTTAQVLAALSRRPFPLRP